MPKHSHSELIAPSNTALPERFSKHARDRSCNNKHPNGRIAPGNGGFNTPWSWHFVPETVRMVDVSIEVCDGTPSYVETHRSDYLLSGYCPWGARVVAVVE